MAEAEKEQTMTDNVDTSVEKPATILWGDKEVAIGELPDHAILYLLRYGAKQSFADAVAGLKKKFLEDGKTEEEIQVEFAKLQAERWEKILAGTISVRVGGTRQSSDDKIRADIAKGMILDSAKAKGKKAPTAEALKAMVEAVLVKYAEKIEAELLRRKAAQASEVDLDDLL